MNASDFRTKIRWHWYQKVNWYAAIALLACGASGFLVGWLIYGGARIIAEAAK